jgi:hypothetical protein
MPLNVLYVRITLGNMLAGRNGERHFVCVARNFPEPKKKKPCIFVGH